MIFPLLQGKKYMTFSENVQNILKKNFLSDYSKQICLKQFPEAKRTYATLSDGTFTGGNMMFMHKKYHFYRSGKKLKNYLNYVNLPLKLANWLGWSFIFKAIFHCLSIKKNAEERFQSSCKLIVRLLLLIVPASVWMLISLLIYSW